MAYLSLNSSAFLGNYDSLVEQCFDYAFENEDECLFEEVLLNELSHSLKMRAATKSRYRAYLTQQNMDNIKNGLKYGMYDTADKRNDARDSYDFNDSENFRNRFKRKRIYKYAASVTPGSKFKNHDAEGNEYLWDHTDTEQNAYKSMVKDIENLEEKEKEFEKQFDQQNQNSNNNNKDSKTNSSVNLENNDNNKNKIKAFIESLKKKYDEIKKKINDTPPEKRTLLQKFMHKIIQMIDKLKGFLNK